MTGLYPSQHGVYNNLSNPTRIHNTIYPGVRMFSEGLRESGYNLAYAGKWHVSDVEGPGDRGWQELTVTSNKGSYRDRDVEQWREKASLQDEGGQRKRGEILRPGWGNYQLYQELPTSDTNPYGGHNDPVVVQSALDALPRLAEHQSPWCLFVGPHGPHDPFHVPDRFVRMYDPKSVPLPPSFADTLADKPRIYQRARNQFWDQLSEDEVRESIAHYWAYCTMEDELFGQVLDALDATGQAENTLVLRLSDHGDYCAAHGLYCKGVPAFREAYNIACIARWPNGIERRGREVDDFVTLADFAPTFLELAGCDQPSNLTGHSLTPFIRNERPDDWPDTFYSQFNGVELYYSQRIVMGHDYKYVYNGFDFDELYDLSQDPHEMVNLAGNPEYDDVKRELVRKMWRFAGETKDIIFNQYATVAFAPWGPADAF
jgi:arylsulfatase A-like enzyme